MKFIRKILGIINHNSFHDKFLDDHKNLNEVLLEKRLEIFKEKVTPELAKIGLNNWDGKYLWFSDFNNEGVKHVVQYNPIKFYAGSFSFGNCFYSVPTISGNSKLINHKTDKSTIIHFFKRLDGWQDSIENNNPNNQDEVSTINEKIFRETLEDVLQRNIPKLENWFNKTQSIDSNIKSLIDEINHPPNELGQRIISCEYILGFLYKQIGDIESSEFWMKKHFDKKLNSDQETDLILKKIKN